MGGGRRGEKKNKTREEGGMCVSCARECVAAFKRGGGKYKEVGL